MGKFKETEFNKIVYDYSKMIFRIAYSYTKSEADSKDIVQEVFICLYQTHKVFKDSDHIKNWLIRVAINKSINLYKKKKKEVKNSDYINNMVDNSSKDDNEEIREYVMALKDNYRNVIILYYYDNYSIKEISNILNISENNVKVILNRARAKIKEQIIKRRSM